MQEGLLGRKWIITDRLPTGLEGGEGTPYLGKHPQETIFGGKSGGQVPKGEQEKEAPGLSAHQGGFAHSFNRHLLCTYSVTGTAPLQTAPTQKDEDRRGLWIQKQLASSSGLKTTPPPRAGRETSSINNLH